MIISSTVIQMSYLINHTRPGQEITLTVLRQGQPRDVKVVLGERP